MLAITNNESDKTPMVDFSATNEQVVEEDSTAAIGNVDSIPAKEKSEMREKFESYDELEPTEQRDHIYSMISLLMFFIMPLHALLLKLLYRKSHPYYVEHLIYSLHLHSFTFVSQVFFGLIMLIAPPNQWIILISMAVIVIYDFIAQMIFYQRPWYNVLWKWLLLGLIYTVIISFLLIVGLVISIAIL